MAIKVIQGYPAPVVPINNPFPMGLSSIFGGCFGEPGKQYTSDECVQFLIDHLTSDFSIINNQVTLYGDRDHDEFNDLKTKINDESRWYRLSSKRPDKDEDGNALVGTDRVVRIYEQEDWADARRVLEVTVQTEFGNIEVTNVKVKW